MMWCNAVPRYHHSQQNSHMYSSTFSMQSFLAAVDERTLSAAPPCVPGMCRMKGRVLRAKRPTTASTILLNEMPYVSGGCSHDCPCGCEAAARGCEPATCGWRALCQNVAFSAGRDWHAELCQRALKLPEAERTSVVGVSCLLAIVLQAAAKPRLWNWLEDELRPATEADDHPFVKSARDLAPSFAEVVPPPTLRLRLSLKSEAGALAWRRRMQGMLLRLQSNQAHYAKSSSVSHYPLDISPCTVTVNQCRSLFATFFPR